MKRENMVRLIRAGGLMAAFVCWTVLVLMADVQPIGPLGSSVGLAGLNGSVHRLTGVHMSLYTLTDWLSLIPVGFAAGFTLLGLLQWIRRRKLRRVDRSILVLGGFYLTVLACYLFFEEWAVNVRPVLMEGVLEASYPSSTTMLVLCVMATAVMQLKQRIGSAGCRRWVTGSMTVFSALMVAGRLLSGVHWLTDIIGGALLSAGLVMLYDAVVRWE